ncbi:hypothetical protein MLGJGCBP_05809 [Rhodococcus sp. T7]|nr:hypothetical protein MLGJGCBP_05809 [Rhodococcus sp. T7]
MGTIFPESAAVPLTFAAYRRPQACLPLADSTCERRRIASA